MPDRDEIETFLHRLCDLASHQTLPRFRIQNSIENKLESDFDPVTEADRAAEKAIRAEISTVYPNHSIVGEEFGTFDGSSDYKWIIDPIDGTRAFISGLPVWGTLVGLYHQNRPYAGIVHQPFTDERFFTSGSDSYFRHGSGPKAKLNTRKTRDLGDAIIMTTTPMIMNSADRNRYDQVEGRCKLARYGCDCYAYAMLAAGHVDIVMESALNIYDIAAQIPLIEQAGGIVTDWNGGDASDGGDVLAVANPNLHQKVMDVLTRSS